MRTNAQFERQVSVGHDEVKTEVLQFHWFWTLHAFEALISMLL